MTNNVIESPYKGSGKLTRQICLYAMMKQYRLVWEFMISVIGTKYQLIDRATRGNTDTILFNIDIEGSINKDKTAVLRVFAKMFYNYLGFYGENLKVAKLEQFIAKQGKTEDFHRVFEEKNGAPWIESRDTKNAQYTGSLTVERRTASNV